MPALLPGGVQLASDLSAPAGCVPLTVYMPAMAHTVLNCDSRSTGHHTRLMRLAAVLQESGTGSTPSAFPKSPHTLGPALCSRVLAALRSVWEVRPRVLSDSSDNILAHTSQAGHPAALCAWACPLQPGAGWV